MLGAVAIAALHLGIVERGVHARGAEIVEHDAAWDTAKNSKAARCKRSHVPSVWSKTNSAY